MKAALSLLATLPLIPAALPTDPAQRMGYFAGMAVGALLLLGLVGFGIFAIVMAFVRRTTGWIVTGAIMGGLSLLLCVSLAVAFVGGVVRGVKMGAAASSGSRQTVVGGVEPYTIQFPSDWSIKRKEGPYDVLAMHGTTFVSVIAEEMDVGSTANIAEAARQRAKNTGTDVEMSETTPITIDGRDWLQFTVKCKIKLVPFAYQFYVHTGKEGTFQIIGWTFQNLWDRDAETLRQSMQTFRFPSPVTAPPVAPTPAPKSK